MTQRRVAVVGAGVAGLGMGIKLQQAGVPFTIFEKAEEVGGTWRDNTYPGLRIDVPGADLHLLHRPRRRLSHLYVEGAEVQGYITGVCDRQGLRENIRFGDEMADARWDGERWHVTTAAGFEDDFDVLVQATGFLHHPRTPAIPGLETFAGESCHSARFDHSITLDGRRVG